MKLIFFIFISINIFAQPEVPALKNYATDLTGTLSASQLNSLNHRLKMYEDTTSNQLVSLMIPGLDDYPLEYFTMDVVEKNKIGQKGKDNGVLLFVAKNDRKMRIEVGYGLEGALPDALASSIVRNVIIPHFKKDDYYAGINSGLNAIISAVAGEYSADNKRDNDDTGPSGFITILLLIFFFFTFFFRGGRKGRRSGYIFYPGSFGGSSRGGGSGFGGFSGGGGGFGGGGASGSW